MGTVDLQPIAITKPFRSAITQANVRRACHTVSTTPAVRNAAGHIHPRVDEVSSRSRRAVLHGSAAALCGLLSSQPPAHGVQGLTAGRIPGLSGPDGDGFRTYTRPEGKSGGHGVGWSELPRYSFKVPEGWEETAVSIADLGGTEIDVRFTSKDQGSLAVVVAPVLRFADVGFNADVHIEELGPPDKIISGFAPELFGAPLSEDDVLDTEVVKGPLTFYRWELKPHKLVAATAFRNRMLLLALTANGRQWRKNEAKLRAIQHSFIIVDA